MVECCSSVTVEAAVLDGMLEVGLDQLKMAVFLKNFCMTRSRPIICFDHRDRDMSRWCKKPFRLAIGFFGAMLNASFLR